MNQENQTKKFGGLIITILAIVVIVGGVFAFQNRNQNSADKQITTQQENPSKNSMERKPDTAMMSKGDTTYSGALLAGTSAPLINFNKIDYDKAIASNKLVVLYFYANWCPLCKVEFPEAQAAFNQLTSDQVVGFRVNFKDSDTDQDETALARQFGVPYQHTKVLVKGEKTILKAPDSWNRDRYISEINKVLVQ